VHEVVYPANRAGRGASSETDNGPAGTEERGEDVITLAGQGERSFLGGELRLGSNVTERDGDEREPVSLLYAGYKPGNGIGATVKEAF